VSCPHASEAARSKKKRERVGKDRSVVISYAYYTKLQNTMRLEESRKSGGKPPFLTCEILMVER
jgi:hypothetical protein